MVIMDAIQFLICENKSIFSLIVGTGQNVQNQSSHTFYIFAFTILEKFKKTVPVVLLKAKGMLIPK